MPYVIVNAVEGATGTGPRTNYADSDQDTPYLIVGAYDNVNNVDSGSRELVLKVAAGLSIQGLQAPPAGAETVDLVVDKNTGRIYRQS